jgi:hypothetical protein
LVPGVGTRLDCDAAHRLYSLQLSRGAQNTKRDHREKMSASMPQRVSACLQQGTTSRFAI